MSKYSLRSVPALIVVTTAMAWGMPAQALGLLGGVNTNAGVGTSLGTGAGVGIGVNAEGAAGAQMGAGASTSANGGVPMDGMQSTGKKAAQAGKKTIKRTGNGVGSAGANGRVGVQGEVGGNVQ